MGRKLENNLSTIQLLILDVDGVLTDGGVFVDSEGRESLRFSRIDGFGILLLQKAGVKVGVISQENSKAIEWRLKKLNIQIVELGSCNKLEAYSRWKIKYQLQDENTAFCCDDIQDIPLAKTVGFSAAPSNALPLVKATVNYISKNTGGNGFVREICDKIREARIKSDSQTRELGIIEFKKANNKRRAVDSFVKTKKEAG